MMPKEKGTTRAAHRFRRFARRATLLAILAIVTPALWFSGNYAYQVILTDKKSDVLASEDALVESFYLVVHTSDGVDQSHTFPLNKWGPDVSVYYHQSVPGWHRRLTEHQFEILSKYTGIRFHQARQFDPNAGISVFYAPLGTSAGEMARRFGIDQDRVQLATCYGIYEWGDEGTVSWSHVVFSRPEGERRTEACIVEETAQVMGLPADRATYFPTVFTNDRARPITLSLNDKILLRSLYDPAIKSGMTLEQTRTLIPGIIRRLVTGVKARGEQALFQN